MFLLRGDYLATSCCLDMVTSGTLCENPSQPKFHAQILSLQIPPGILTISSACSIPFSSCCYPLCSNYSGGLACSHFDSVLFVRTHDVNYYHSALRMLFLTSSIDHSTVQILIAGCCSRSAGAARWPRAGHGSSSASLSQVPIKHEEICVLSQGFTLGQHVRVCANSSPFI